ncbi:MAG TPA: von Willebrand factor type A domain-containing protein [Gammaproteobacteria bacterium]
MYRSLYLFRLALLLALALGAAGCSHDREASPLPDEPESQELGMASPPPLSTQPGRPKVAEPVLKAEGKRRVRELAAEAPLAYASDLSGVRQPSAPTHRDRFAPLTDNPLHLSQQEPVSTFSIDVDTGAYALVRRAISEGRLPASDAVRVEELINYFDYAYAQPRNGTPFSLVTEVGPTPWNPHTRLVHVGIQGKSIAASERPAANLVFLIDVSGSMDSPDKLPLLKAAFRLLTKQLTAQDRVTLVVYAGASGVVLEPTAGDHQAKILSALDRLAAGGSTHGSAGIQLAYAMAEASRIKGGINRVLLATDGDFNVGTVNHEQLIDLIEQQRSKGITLTTLGFGQGNYNDQLMEQLADKGNGNYAYIDTLNEARKVLVEELSATLETIAKDVKIQIEWNPALVSEYRLIGYENRLLNREDFNNDKVDAGDIGAGHTVTALYEITLKEEQGQIDPLRYGSSDAVKGNGDELAFLKLRYKAPEGETSQLISQPISRKLMETKLAGTSENYRFSAAVAAFGQLLRGGRYTGKFAYDDVEQLARNARGEDTFGYRSEFLQLVRQAATL